MVRSAPVGPYQKPPTPPTQQKQTKPTKPPKTTKSDWNQKGNGRGCPTYQKPYQKQQKIIKKQPKPPQPSNLMEIIGNGRVSPKGALPKNTKPTKTNKNKQNHQNHQTPPNLLEIKKERFVCLFVCLCVCLFVCLCVCVCVFVCVSVSFVFC